MGQTDALEPCLQSERTATNFISGMLFRFRLSLLPAAMDVVSVLPAAMRGLSPEDVELLLLSLLLSVKVALYDVERLQIITLAEVHRETIIL